MFIEISENEVINVNQIIRTRFVKNAKTVQIYFSNSKGSADWFEATLDQFTKIKSKMMPNKV